MEGFHRRIRALRKDRGWTGCEFAKMAGFSPAFLSLIEHGQRVPSVGVAARIAELLGEDPEPYRRWAAYNRLPEDLRPPSPPDRGIQARGADRGSRRPRPPGRPATDPLEFDGAATVVDPSQLIVVPVLMPGRVSNPPVPSELMGRFYLDPQLISHQGSSHLLAVRVDRSNCRFVAGLMRPGDLVVIDREISEQLAPTLIYAWITMQGVLLSRAIFTQSEAILAAIGDERVAPLKIPYQSEAELHQALLGVVIWSTRSWASSPAE